MNNQLKEQAEPRWKRLIVLAGAYVACTVLLAIAAQLGLFSSIFSDYFSGDAVNWAQNRARFSTYLVLSSKINLSNVYFQFVDDINPVLIVLVNLSAVIFTILILGACGTAISKRIGVVAAALVALNPFFWLVVLGPTKEPFAICIVATSAAIIMRVRLPWMLWIGAGVIAIIGLFTRMEFAVLVILGTAFVFIMRRVRLEQFTARIIVLGSIAGLVLIPLLFYLNPALPNARNDLWSPGQYDLYSSLAPDATGATSVSISMTLASSAWTGWIGVLYRLAVSVVHAPLRPAGFATEDGRIAIYLLFQWANEYFTTFGFPALVLTLMRRQARSESSKIIAALSFGLAIFICCYTIVQVRYFIPLIPFFILLVFMLERRERIALTVAVAILTIVGPISLFMLGHPPSISKNNDLPPGANPYLPSWIEHERPLTDSPAP